jgi:hypothetical protein
MHTEERIDKINKLLSLAASENPEESKSAVYMAFKLARSGGLKLTVDRGSVFAKIYSHQRGLLSFTCGFCNHPMVAEFDGPKQVTDWLCTSCRATGLQLKASREEQQKAYDQKMKRFRFWAPLSPVLLVVVFFLIRAIQYFVYGV